MQDTQYIKKIGKKNFQPTLFKISFSIIFDINFDELIYREFCSDFNLNHNK